MNKKKPPKKTRKRAPKQCGKYDFVKPLKKIRCANCVHCGGCRGILL